MNAEFNVRKEMEILTFKATTRSDSTGVNAYGLGRLNKIIGLDRATFRCEEEDGHHYLYITPSNENSLKVVPPAGRSQNSWLCTITGHVADDLKDGGYVNKKYTAMFEITDIANTPFGTFRTLRLDLDTSDEDVEPEPDEIGTGDGMGSQLDRIEKMVADLTEDMKILRRWLNAE